MTGAVPDPDVRAALAALGKRRLVLAIHDPSFPGTPGEDPGRGSPHSAAGQTFLAFVRRLGFDGVVLGPRGMPTRDNPSPYDATLFSRNLLSVDVASVADDPLWRPLVAGLERAGALGRPPAVPAGRLGRVEHGPTFDAQHRWLADLHAGLRAARALGDPIAGPIDTALAAFRDAGRDWLEGDALYHAVAERHRGRHPRDWPCRTDRGLPFPLPGEEDRHRQRAQALRRELADPVERYVLGQLIVHRQHAAFRVRLRALGLRLYGDLQVGLSPCDEWQRADLYLSRYHLGAPPSRTNPEGQPWGYRAFDPDRHRGPGGGPGPVARFLAARIAKVMDECDGLRIDHPHGLVCPWVYHAGDSDPYRAVRAGARLFSAPHLPDHPSLARHAIARPEQIDGTLPRHADRWVRELDHDQVERYAVLMDVLMDAVRARGGTIDDVVCEVLSTCPYPLARVMARHGLGRFRVTQKADVHVQDDVYRSENARPEDWIMVGNHDTPPIWKLTRDWHGTAEGRERSQYLAHRLVSARDAPGLAAALAADPHRLAEAHFADILASAASHVLVFFSDLLGLEAVYNRPGTVSPENWTLRVPFDYATRYPAACATGSALSLPRALATALRARGPGSADRHRGLIERLERRPVPSG